VNFIEGLINCQLLFIDKWTLLTEHCLFIN